MKLSRKLASAGVAIAASVALAACGSSTSTSSGGGGGSTGTSSTGSTTATSGYDAASSNVVNPSTQTGGTMNLVATEDCDSWDPARTYYGWCWNMQRLFTRSLMGYSVVNGTSFKLAPDLATAAGKHNATDTEWTYTLKPGLKWSDGKAITPMDVKYGIERLFASDVITGGPTSYLTSIINAPKGYAGPYKSGPTGGDLPNSAISTTKDSITFHLKSPFGDFDSLMAMPVSAPVPYKTEGGPGYVGATYTKHPMSSGPFEIKSYTPSQSITFVRNKYWSQSTDTIRHPLVNEIDMTIDTDPDDADTQLLAGKYDANASGPVGATALAKIETNPTMKADADDPEAASTGFLTVYPSVIPNKYCREAIFYATNKAGLIVDAGGSTAGLPANSMTPPGIPGYDPSYNPYPTGADNTGDLAAAKAALAKCGKPNGFTTKMAYSTATSQNKKYMTTEQAALARVGIKVIPAPNDGSTYYSTFIGSPSNVQKQGFGISENGWGADFPTDYGFWYSIADSNAILSVGNSNYPSIKNKTVDGVLTKAMSGKATTTDYENLDKAVMGTATYLPYRFEKNLYYRSPQLTNVTSDNVLAFGIYDFVNAGIGSGS